MHTQHIGFSAITMLVALKTGFRIFNGFNNLTQQKIIPNLRHFLRPDFFYETVFFHLVVRICIEYDRIIFPN